MENKPLTNQNTQTQEPPKLTKTIKERISAFYEWTATHEFVLDDMLAIICGVLVQAGVKGLSHEIKVAGKTFSILVEEKEKAQSDKEKKESK